MTQNFKVPKENISSTSSISCAQYNSLLSKKHSQYDVNTGIVFVSKSTQPTKTNIQQGPNTLDFKVEPGVVNPVESEWVNVGIQPPAKYPIALMPGQTQDFLSLYSKRFK